MIILDMILGSMGLAIGIILLLLFIVIAIESIFLGKRIARKFLKAKIILVVTISNLLSTIIGALGLAIFWRFLIDRTIEIFDLTINYDSAYFKIAFCLFAFVLTLVFEIPINLIILKSDYESKGIIINTFYANIITYILLGFIYYNNI